MQWTSLARCPDEELNTLIAALHDGKRIARGEPIGAPGVPIDITPEWWSPRSWVRAEYADGQRLVQRNGVCTPLLGVTIVDRVNSRIWQNRISSPRSGFVRVEYRNSNGAAEPVTRDTAIRQALEDGLTGQDFANRVCELCQVKRDSKGFGLRWIQMLAKKIREEQ